METFVFVLNLWNVIINNHNYTNNKFCYEEIRLTRKFKINSSGKLFFESVYKYDIMEYIGEGGGTVKIINTIKNTISTFYNIDFHAYEEGWQGGWAQ